MTTKAKSSAAALALVAALGLGGAGVAQAHGSDDVFWSIAMSQPGIQIGVSSGPVVVPAPYPVQVVRPYPVYVPPRVVYVPPPVYHHGYYGHGYARGHDRWDDHRGGREQFARNDRNDGRGHGGNNGPRPGAESHMGNRR